MDWKASEIAKIDDVGEAAKWARTADAAAIFYAAQGKHEEAQAILDIGLRFKRQAGNILLPPGKGGRTPRKKGARTDLSNGVTQVTPYQEALDGAGISHATAHAWQQLARVLDDKFEGYIAAALLWPDNYSIGDALKYAGAFYGRSDSVEWETPQWLFDILHAELHFELDVCAHPKTAKCKKFYTPDDNGLLQTWAPRRCWMNPPYGQAINDWMQKALKESRDGALVACLVPAAVETNWWWDSALHGEMRLIKGRLKFATTPAPFPSAVVILSGEHKRKVVWWDIQNR
jgi:phage N-6-adenine-methyltransferase